MLRGGGRLGIASWGRPDEQELNVVSDVISPPSPCRHSFGEPGRLEALVTGAGFTVTESGDLEVPYGFVSDDELLEAHQLDAAHAGVELDEAAVLAAAARFRGDDRAYRFRNRFRFVCALRSDARGL